MEPVENEYIDTALDKGKMARSAIQKKVGDTPCPAALVTNIHLTTMIRNNK